MASGNGKNKRRKVYVVLPAYNEEARIGFLLSRIDDAMREAALQFEVIVVDDGSTDATLEIVTAAGKKMPIVSKRHEANAGLGATIRDGLVAAAEMANPRDTIVTMDADDTHAPGLILRMVRMISEGCDVVIASRYQPQARVIGVPLVRRAMSRAASTLFRVVFPINGVRDYTCGYRAYRAEVIQNAIGQYGPAFVDEDGFQSMVDILLKLRKMNLVFGEVPLILRYDFKEGASKMKVLRTARKTLSLMVRRRLGR
jgi:dolichol-phosphate mannosyltransferase